MSEPCATSRTERRAFRPDEVEAHALVEQRELRRTAEVGAYTPAEIAPALRPVRRSIRSTSCTLPPFLFAACKLGSRAVVDDSLRGIAL